MATLCIGKVFLSSSLLTLSFFPFSPFFIHALFTYMIIRYQNTRESTRTRGLCKAEGEGSQDTHTVRRRFHFRRRGRADERTKGGGRRDQREARASEVVFDEYEGCLLITRRLT